MLEAKDTSRAKEALEHLEAFCSRRQTGSVEIHIKDGVVAAVEAKPVMRIDATELSTILAGLRKAKEINIQQDPGSSTIKLRVVEHKQLRIAPRG